MIQKKLSWAVLALIFSMVSVFVSCSDDDDDSSTAVVFTVRAEGETYDYKYASSKTETVVYEELSYAMLTYGGVLQAGKEGDFNAANLVILYWPEGEGEYTLVETFSDFIAATDTKTMWINSTIQTGGYVVTGDKAAITIVDGKYHIALLGSHTGKITAANNTTMPSTITLNADDVYDQN